MGLRNQDLKRLQEHRVPAWWLRRQARHLRALDPGVGAGVRAGRRRDRRAAAVGDAATRSAGRRTPSGTRTRCASPTARSRGTTARSTATGPYADVRRRLGGRPRAVGSRRVGGAVRGDRRPLRRARDQAHDGYCLWPTDVPNPHRPGWHCRARRRRRAGRSGARRGDALRRLLLGRARLDVQRPADRLGRRHARRDPARRLPRLRRGAGARARSRRYRPSVLWNDIAWPSPRASSSWPLLARLLRARCPTASSTTGGCRGARCSPPRDHGPVPRRHRRRRPAPGAKRDAGLIPPKPPHFDVRTPEYVVFDDMQRKPWECVRGMDQSFGYNAESRPEHFLAHDELLWIAHRHRGQGRQPAPQRRPARRRRADPRRAAHPARVARRVGAAAHATPSGRLDRGSTPGRRLPDGHPVRYTARRRPCTRSCSGARGTITLSDVARDADHHESRTVDGSRVPWRAGPEGIVIDLPVPDPTAPADPEPAVVVLRQVDTASGRAVTVDDTRRVGRRRTARPQPRVRRPRPRRGRLRLLAGTATAAAAALRAGPPGDRLALCAPRRPRPIVARRSRRVPAGRARIGVLGPRGGGHANPTSIELAVADDGDDIVGRFVLHPAFEGAPGRAHGGIVAACSTTSPASSSAACATRRSPGSSRCGSCGPCRSAGRSDARPARRAASAGSCSSAPSHRRRQGRRDLSGDLHHRGPVDVRGGARPPVTATGGSGPAGWPPIPDSDGSGRPRE